MVPDGQPILNTILFKKKLQQQKSEKESKMKIEFICIATEKLEEINQLLKKFEFAKLLNNILDLQTF